MDKVLESPAAAIHDVVDGSTVAIAGFGLSHRYPSSLIAALRDKGSRDLCIVCNALGAPGDVRGAVLAEKGQISHLIAAFTARPNMKTPIEDQIAAGTVTAELVPQGVLVDRMRAAGAGIAAFYSPTGVGTEVTAGKEVREFNGKTYVLEHALPVDFAFLRAAVGDRAGNLKFRGGSQNFNPSFAKAARVAIAEVDEIVEVGELAPGEIDLPGIFVSRVVQSMSEMTVNDIRRRRGRAPESGREYNGKPALTRTAIAKRVAGLLNEGTYVNLGTGLPSLVSDYLPGRDIMLHAENGILGFGEIVRGEDIDPDVYNAGGQFTSMLPGGSFFDSVTSFEIARGGKLDAVVLGAYQVDQEGNLANWSTPAMTGGGIGGAMDLVASGARLIILMEHCDSKGQPKLVSRCNYPLTGKACVDTIVTDLAVLHRDDLGFVIHEVAPGFSPEEIVTLSEMPLRIASNVIPMPA